MNALTTNKSHQIDRWAHESWCPVVVYMLLAPNMQHQYAYGKWCPVLAYILLACNVHYSTYEKVVLSTFIYIILLADNVQH